MKIIEEYQKIRNLSLKLNILKQNIGKFVYIYLNGGYRYIVRVLAVVDTHCLMEAIDQGIEGHPVISYPIEKIKKITLS